MDCFIEKVLLQNRYQTCTPSLGGSQEMFVGKILKSMGSIDWLSDRHRQ